MITKHDGTGGRVTVDTVTAQLMYEVQSTHYLGPDVTTHLDSIRLSDDGPDRVRISGVRGAGTARAAQGLRQRAGRLPQLRRVRAHRPRRRGQGGLGAGAARARLTASPIGHLDARPPTAPDADTEEGASTLLRCTVQDPSPDPVGRAFSSAAVELALASYPGFTMTAPPGNGTPYGVYRAEYVDRARRRPPRHARRRSPRRWSPTARCDGHASSRARRRTRRRTARGAARHVRARPVRRQGRRRQPRALGRSRRLAATTTGSPGWSRWSPRTSCAPCCRRRRPRRRGVRAAQPRRRQRRDPRPARAGRGRLDPLRPAGQGPRRVGAVAVRRHPRRLSS